MQITIISASPRSGSQSREVSEYLARTLRAIDSTVTATVIDLGELQLPVYNDDEANKSLAAWQPVAEQLAASDGFVFVSPEWDGMFSVALHNLFHYVKHELADKPVYLVGVSAGRGGRYPLLQMRGMGYKNKHFVIIPESLFVDQVKDNLVDGQIQNEHIVKRADYGLRTLLEYTKALTLVRESGVTNYEQFPNGW